MRGKLEPGEALNAPRLVPSMRPAHYAREVFGVHGVRQADEEPSMRPAHYAREVRRRSY